MNKNLLTLGLIGTIALSGNMISFAHHANDCPQTPPACETKTPPCGHHHKMHEDFNQRLNLTEAQKIKAKKIRENGHKQMKPIMDAIQAKKQEKETVKLSRIAVQAQNEKIEAIDKDIIALRKKAHEVRMQNMKEFEAILTPEQKTELQKMKEEGRKRFEEMKREKCDCGCDKCTDCRPRHIHHEDCCKPDCKSDCKNDCKPNCKSDCKSDCNRAEIPANPNKPQTK